MPLSCVYYLEMASQAGYTSAQRFFEWSGEVKNEVEKYKGKPEALIMFTTEDVIKCMEKGRCREYRDEWFNSSSDKKDIGEIIDRYLEKLEENTIRSLKYVCMVKVDINDFSQTVEVVGTTISALRDKEMWFNMVGGANTINAALLIAGLLSGASTRYYYVFCSQEEIKYLHPRWINSPKALDAQMVNNTVRKWVELPLFFMGIERLETLYEILKTRGGKINRNEATGILGEIPIEKLRGRILMIEDTTVSAGVLLERIMEIYGKIKSRNVQNLTDWKKWAEQQGILKVLRWEK
ncbi:MAG: hypothetical protein QW620_04940 [Thermoplasmata archaeon]